MKHYRKIAAIRYKMCQSSVNHLRSIFKPAEKCAGLGKDTVCVISICRRFKGRICCSRNAKQSSSWVFFLEKLDLFKIIVLESGEKQTLKFSKIVITLPNQIKKNIVGWLDWYSNNNQNRISHFLVLINCQPLFFKQGFLVCIFMAVTQLLDSSGLSGRFVFFWCFYWVFVT